MTSYDKDDVEQNGNYSSHTTCSSKFFCYNRSDQLKEYAYLRNRPVARKRKYAWNVITSHPVALLQHVKYCSEWQNRQVGTLKGMRGYNYTDYPI